jgi:diguanylate cyclase (GGDEF)-like protein
MRVGAAPSLGTGAMTAPVLDDARSSDPVERLLEESWETRSRRIDPRELIVESLAGVLFLACAIPLALPALLSQPVNPLLVAVLVGMYALASRMIEFPIGAGYVVPSYMVLVPMLLLLPPAIAPLLTAAGLVVGTLGKAAAGRAELKRALLAIPDAWHSLGPALVLALAAKPHGVANQAALYAMAFGAGCVIDLVSATVRESAILGVGSRVQARVIGLVWLIDACVAPLGLLVAHAAHNDARQVLLLLPLNGVLLLLARDRSARIAQAQRRLDLVARERTRLQTAVRRLGEALAAKLDIEALTDIVLRGSIEALDADGGRLSLGGSLPRRELAIGGDSVVERALQASGASAEASDRPCQLEHQGVWALALPFGFDSDAGRARGALAVARKDRPFRDDEEAVMGGLVERARDAAADIVAHHLLREQAMTDALTRLGNRRKLTADIDELMVEASASNPLVLILFDLDGFKSYNDTFGHLAGDAVLARLGGKLAAAVASHGTAYRLGGDEFCVLLSAKSAELESVVVSAAGALEESGENFDVGASYGAVLIPHEATTLDYALQLADERMYTRKRGRPSIVADQTRDVLIRIMQAKQPSLEDHASEVATLSRRVGRRFAMTTEELDELVRAAELHDVGKVGIPDAILDKAGALSEQEREFVRQHTLLGERILNAAPALRPVAMIVRASHERWDGGGYPDGLAGERIPLGARIVSACDAYEAMTTNRCYRDAMSHEAACEELRREAGRQFDPEVVEALVAELSAVGRGPQDTTLGRQDDQGDGSPPIADEFAAYLRTVLSRPLPDQFGVQAPLTASEAAAADAQRAL